MVLCWECIICVSICSLMQDMGPPDFAAPVLLSASPVCATCASLANGANAMSDMLNILSEP